MSDAGGGARPVSVSSRLAGLSPRILVLGDVILDHYIFGRARRISPEAPVPVVNAAREQCFPGGAANVMANLAGLGAKVEGLAVVGPETNSIRLEGLLNACGVHTDGFVLQDDWATPRKCRVVAGHQHALRIDYEQDCRLENATFEQLAGSAQQLIPECDLVVVSDYAKGTLSSLLIQSVIALARDHRRRVIVDPKGGDPLRYSGASVLTPNAAETEHLTGVRIHDEQSLSRAAGTLKRMTGADWIVVTRGEKGIAVVGESMTTMPGRPAAARDVSGAGDTVVAALAFGLSAGLSVPEAADLANTVAARAVDTPGIAVLTRAELLAAAGEHEPPSVVATRRDLTRHITRLRRLGRRIVFTNGCFDVIHSGHVQYLEQSRALGDVLIVGLNSDAGVSRLKGPGRPVNRESDRAAVLAGLRCVDHVVIFDEDTPYELIADLRPHVLTKGGDYSRAEIVGSDLVEETVVLPFVAGRSTSTVIQSLMEAPESVSPQPDRYDAVPADQHDPETLGRTLEPVAVVASHRSTTT
jgi:D-beta-D-heptose 7-phosphate kinase/D-beta-D-heptose 1-phosphate adenosyltransferase